MDSHSVYAAGFDAHRDWRDCKKLLQLAATKISRMARNTLLFSCKVMHNGNGSSEGDENPMMDTNAHSYSGNAVWARTSLSTFMKMVFKLHAKRVL